MAGMARIAPATINRPTTRDPIVASGKGCWRIKALLAEVRRRLFILRANELDQLRVEHDALVDLDGPRSRVGFRIVDRDLDFQIAVVHATEPLGPFRGVRQWAPVDIEPAIVPETGRLDDERVAFTFPRGI